MNPDQIAETLMSTQEGRTAIARAMQKRNPQLPHFAAMRVLTPEKVEEIRVAVFERGMTYSEAAAAFGISKSSVARAVNEIKSDQEMKAAPDDPDEPLAL